MSELTVLEAIADALDSASSTLRQRIALTKPAAPSEAGTARGPVERARAIHPQLGERQAQVLEVLAQAGEDGTSTGFIARKIDYDQPNVYITLRALVGIGFV